MNAAEIERLIALVWNGGLTSIKSIKTDKTLLIDSHSFKRGYKWPIIVDSRDLQMTKPFQTNRSRTKRRLFTPSVLFAALASGLGQSVITSRPRSVTSLAKTKSEFSLVATGAPALDYRQGFYSLSPRADHVISTIKSLQLCAVGQRLKPSPKKGTANHEK